MHTVVQNKHMAVTTRTPGVQLKQMFNYKQGEEKQEKGFFKSNCQTNQSCWKHRKQKSKRKSELGKNETNPEAEG